MDDRPSKKRKSTVKIPKRASTPGNESPSSPNLQAAVPIDANPVTKPEDADGDMAEEHKDDDVELDDDIEDELLHPRKGVDKEAERALLATFTQEQVQRYEVFRRAHFQKGGMKKFLQGLLGQNVAESSAIVVAGAAKLFVGEMTEKAREIMEEWGDTGGIQPEHLREAYRRYKHDPASITPAGSKTRLFR
ncbi:hypothetical protein SpCBS45565_g06345 [Spizellomyces sp. 'palustris']|nr:hypothetical protein SpCBS45565_g06345 [Spizellomyces sp. 'palustris']